MKKLLLLLGLIFCASHHAHAANCPISAGASSATIVSTIQGCSSPNTVTFAAGTYSVSSGISVPCGVSITGPTVAPGPYTTGDGYLHWGYTPTAIVNFTGVSVAFNFGSCTATHSMEYLEVNTNHPSPDGGQNVYAGSVTSNFTISYNYFHGNQALSGGSQFGDGMILFDGNSAQPPDNNDTVSWNRIGASGDCSNVMSQPDGSGSSNGACVGTGVHTNATNLTVANNTVYYQEQGLKFYEGGSGAGSSGGGMATCVNCVVENNDWSNIHRIDFEEQANNNNQPTSGSSPAISLTVQYNSIHDPYTPNTSSYGLSVANGCTNQDPSLAGCANYTDYNVIIDNVRLFSRICG